MSLRPPRRRDVEEGDADNPLHDATWLYSYADLMTQLLIFSILMVTVVGLKESPAEARADPRQAQLERTVRDVEKYVAESKFRDALAVDRAADRLVIRMKSAILFDPGQAKLTPAAEEVLGGLVAVLSKVPSPLRVEGHTDDVPIQSARFPSNWELSTARAISVVEYLEDQGVAKERLSASGFGEFHPIIANDSAEHRALNRRVEIVVIGG
ncbi:OmpA/MotB family protein [Anaeromyxobacter paludicola]|uniref:Chemotaxis protein MotB n=1 Tax=Anaeromyxobacter paludicola TaxID=2918171 RepID=A0ABM7X8C5_9BACT|nr:OmpA family protein [Anaeromyxobacter paludicola]BDG08076.1 chemotaxis protein MotB [Anaeromyxobacter paludicola]